MKKYLFLFFILTATLGCAQENTATYPTPMVLDGDTVMVYEHEYLVKVGDIAPDFTLQLTDGSTFRLSDYRGKVVMLQFTASWCGICRREMPFIESDIWQKHKSNPDFVLVGVDREETKKVIDEYTAKVGTTYPMAIDDKGDVFAKYALRKSGITRNVLIDRDGRIVMLTRRYNEEEFASLVAKINEMLK